MATELDTTAQRQEPAIEALLARLRRRIRAYVCLDGAASIAIALGAAFWVSLALDWLFELPVPLRAIVLIGVVVGVGYLVSRLLVARLGVPLADRNMALLLERRFGQFHDGLLTAVELAERPEHAAEFNPQMISHTRREALAQAGAIDVGQVLNTAPLVRRVTLALALVGSVAVFAVSLSDAMAVWVRRDLLLSAELWPRDTHLSVVGLGESGRVKVARGADWPLLVKADAALGREIPEVVEVRFRTQDGVRGRENMSREGMVEPGQADFQQYAHTFKSVLAPLEFYVAGGDDRAGPFYLDVVESPTISRMTLACEYPPYMRRAAREIPVSGLVQLPRGTRVSIQAEANKPLVSVQIDDITDESAPQSKRLDLAAEGGRPVQQFQFDVPPLEGDKILLFTLHDADGIRSLEGVRLAIAAVADEPPQVNVQLRGIGTAITPSARLPAAGEVADDYGVAKIWFDYHAGDKPAQQRPFAAPVDGQEKLAVDDALEVGELALEPKQKFHIAVAAADGCTLGSGPNQGASQRYVLDVVTPEQLRSMLEARELMLRRRFETIVQEFTDSRNLLAEIDFAAQAPLPPDKGDAKAAADDTARPSPDPAAGPAAAASPNPDEAAARFSPQGVQATRVAQNVDRSAHEIVSLAQAFDEIREEMINNRVDTEELKIRLKDGVADPLKRVVAERFGELQKELQALVEQVGKPAEASATKTAALVRMDAILVEMKQILDKMLELETFNEVLDMLRGIIEEQEKVSDETKQKQKDKLRDLLE
ncbi:MAG: hypothetical protein AB7O59_18925 [Pirellulales bacterium]